MRLSATTSAKATPSDDDMLLTASISAAALFLAILITAIFIWFRRCKRNQENPNCSEAVWTPLKRELNMV